MNNSEILFLYDAVLCNPNGDIDEENQPRMDRETNRNLVSDVRLKRYIRDYLLGKGYEIFVAELEGKTVDATTRLEEFCRKYGLLSQKENLQNALKDDEKRKQIFEKVLDQMFDVRVFGAVIPIKPGEERAGQQETFTGPVQFNWGYSLNPVTINLSSSITSIFAGRTRGEGEQYGTIGKDWRVFYSLIAFHGIVSAKRGKITRLKEEDIFILDDALLKSIPVEATTRSKVGQFPRLLLRVEYKDDETFLGDLRPYLKIRPNEGIDLEKIRTVEDYELEVSPLLELLKDNEDRINRFFVWQHNSL
ncbi:MAG: type I-B CRISPR-associated protein Cas7/Csh2, partial [bacterium]